MSETLGHPDSGAAIAEQSALLSPTPVLPEWFDAYKKANLTHPQQGYGICLIGGNAVMQSLARCEVDLQYVLASDYTDGQMAEIRETVHRVHTAYGIALQPEGHTDDEEKLIPDGRLRALWGMTVGNVIRTIVEVATDRESMTPAQIALRAGITEEENSLCMTPDEELASLLTAFSQEETYLRRMPILAEMYAAGAEALLTPAAKALAKERREEYRHLSDLSGKELNERYNSADYQRRLMMGTVAERVHEVAIQRGVPSDKVRLFMARFKF